RNVASHGRTPLDYAASWGDEKQIDELKKLGITACDDLAFRYRFQAGAVDTLRRNPSRIAWPLKDVTIDHSKELGKGAFGVVYEGVLKDPRAATVKVA